MEREIDLPNAPQAIQHRVDYDGLTWIDFTYPRQEQLRYLRERYHFHELHLDDLLTRSQRPKIEDDPAARYVFIVLHFPLFDEMRRVSLPSELHIFAGDHFIITSHDGRLRPIINLMKDAERPERRAGLMQSGASGLLYRIVESLLLHVRPMLHKLDQRLDLLEEDTFTTRVLETVQDLSYLRRDVISLRRIMRPNLSVVRALCEGERPFLHPHSDVFFADIANGLQDAWDLLDEQKEIIEGLDATLGSLTSHRINQEMKIFTLISVIILPMTLVASILGMNVIIPGAEHPWSLVGALVIMAALGIGLYRYLRYRRLV